MARLIWRDFAPLRAGRPGVPLIKGTSNKKERILGLLSNKRDTTGTPGRSLRIRNILGDMKRPAMDCGVIAVVCFLGLWQRELIPCVMNMQAQAMMAVDTGDYGPLFDDADLIGLVWIEVE